MSPAFLKKQTTDCMFHANVFVWMGVWPKQTHAFSALNRRLNFVPAEMVLCIGKASLRTEWSSWLCQDLLCRSCFAWPWTMTKPNACRLHFGQMATFTFPAFFFSLLPLPTSQDRIFSKELRCANLCLSWRLCYTLRLWTKLMLPNLWQSFCDRATHSEKAKESGRLSGLEVVIKWSCSSGVLCVGKARGCTQVWSSLTKCHPLPFREPVKSRRKLGCHPGLHANITSGNLIRASQSV